MWAASGQRFCPYCCGFKTWLRSMSNSHLSVRRHRRRNRIACVVLQAQRGSYLETCLHKRPYIQSTDKSYCSSCKGASRSCSVDGKRPDDLTLVPWQSGRCATWDVTVVDRLASSYILQSAVIATSAAELAASRKEEKYSTLSHSYEFFPVAVETLRPLSASSQIFLSEIGRRIAQRTSDPRETAFLFQRISVAIQRFNAVYLANTFELADASGVESLRPNASV
jgi:hypothetical protein